MRTRLLVVMVLVVGLASRTAHADRGDRWDVATMGEQTAGAFGIGATSGLVLGLAGAGIGYAINQRNWGVPVVGGFIGGGIGLIAGGAIGVHYIGDKLDGTGRAWGTALGATVGVGAAVGYGVLVVDAKFNPIVKMALGYFVFLVPTVIGYQFSADDTDPAERSLALPLTAGRF